VILVVLWGLEDLYRISALPNLYYSFSYLELPILRDELVFKQLYKSSSSSALALHNIPGSHRPGFAGQHVNISY
jgi:hypothetical protein